MKADLVADVVAATKLSKRDAEILVDAVFAHIIEALHNGEGVELRGFGSFRLRDRGPRTGRNPKTGKPVDVPPKRIAYFRSGRHLKELLNEA